MERYIFYVAAALIMVLVLTVWTNIVVEITKKLVAWDRFPVQVWVAVVALTSTIAAVTAVAQILNITMLWYYWVAAVALGLLVCYAAMYGYDNLYKKIKETYAIIRQIIAGVEDTNQKEE